MERITGYVAITDTIMGVPSLWSADNGYQIMPEVWGTEEHCQKDIIRNYMEHLEQYVNGEREWEDTDTNGPDEYVGTIEIDENEDMVVWNMMGNEIMHKSLTAWRKSL